MNFSFRSLSVTALGLGALALASGCEVSKCKTDDGRDATCAESLERYTLPGSTDTQQQDYEPGMDLDVDHVKGHINVVSGDPGVIVADFVPFTFRGHSKDTEAGDDIQNGIEWSVETGDNQIEVRSSQTGGWDEVGATLTIWLPPEFDGAIRINNQARGSIEEADITIDDVASAWAVRMVSNGLGECDLDGAPSVVDTYASCRGEIEVTNVTDNVTAFSDGLISENDPFGIRVHFAAISEDATGGELESQQGHVELNLPADGNFQITAAPNEDGSVNVVGLPETCEESDNTISCGTNGAIFIVSAGVDDPFDPGNVNMDFH